MIMIITLHFLLPPFNLSSLFWSQNVSLCADYRWNNASETIRWNFGHYTCRWSRAVDGGRRGSQSVTKWAGCNGNDRSTRSFPTRKKQLTAIFREWSVSEIIAIFFSINFNIFLLCSYVTRIDENSPAGTTLVFPEPYIARVSDDDAGKNGVFSLTLLNNNGTFEIFPNVAERKANFIIRVRDNHMLDFEEFTSLSFQVSDSSDAKDWNNEIIEHFTDSRTRTGTGNESLSNCQRNCFHRWC